MKNSKNDFYQRVFKVVREIPSGRVTSYGAIAGFLGAPMASRMVGWAMNQSHYCEDYVPAHRVVNRAGLLTGKHHFEGPDVMKQLLESEGVMVKNDRIENFQSVFWDPGKELNL